MIHTKPIGGSSELEDDLLALLKLDWASEKRVQLELILFANNVYDFVGDIFEDDWRNLYVLALLMLADIHYKIQDSHGLVLLAPSNVSSIWELTLILRAPVSFGSSLLMLLYIMILTLVPSKVSRTR
jgi:hypothetical protein